MKTALIVVADASRAVLMEQKKGVVRPTLLESIANPKGRAQARQLLTDRPGRSASDGNGTHALTPSSDVNDVEEDNFARRLVERIERELANDGRSLSLFMAPKLLGMVRNHLTKATSQRVVHSVAKDLAHLTLPALVDKIAEEMKA